VLVAPPGAAGDRAGGQMAQGIGPAQQGRDVFRGGGLVTFSQHGQPVLDACAISATSAKPSPSELPLTVWTTRKTA